MDGSWFSTLTRSLTRVRSRRGVLAAGGAAALTAVAGAAPAEAAYKVAQPGWRFCPKCRGLFFSPKNEALGRCPAGGKHSPRKDVNYVLYEEGEWATWRRCTKCAGLVVGNAGVCPKGGVHARDPRVFLLWLGEGITGVTDDAWDSCGKCAGLFNFAGGSVGRCPAGGGHQRNGFVAKLVSLY